MKDGGDFSKSIKQQEQKNNYRKVLFQQGRVLTDADWNEQISIQDSHDKTTLRDIIGKNGIPIEEKDSFKITPKVGNTFTIGKGRIYVDGKLVENFAEVGNYGFSIGEDKIIGQPYLPSFTTDDQPISEAIPPDPGFYLAYLRIFDRHITYLEDPDIQESALGESDTSTRSQIVWQVLLHKLEENEFEHKIPNEEEKWSPWIPLRNNEPGEVVQDLRIGRSNDGQFLDVFALSNRVTRKSIRQITLDPVSWEDKWQHSTLGVDSYQEFDITSRNDGGLEILHTFGVRLFEQTQSVHYRIRNSKDARWDIVGADPVETEINAPNLEVLSRVNSVSTQSKIVMNPRNNLEAFILASTRIVHSRKKDKSAKWEQWTVLGPDGAGADPRRTVFQSYTVFLPPDGCIEVYAVVKHLQNDVLSMWYIKQEEPDSIHWKSWTEINPDRKLQFDEITVGLNKLGQVVIFAKERWKRGLWFTVMDGPDSGGNGWKRVGSHGPDSLITVPGCISVQKDRKKNRLEVFAIFEEAGSNERGKVWRISEDEKNNWESEWKMINNDQILRAYKVFSTTDKKDRINIFAIGLEGESESTVYHSYLEDENELSCEMDIPSWDSKIKPSNWQLAARTTPHPQTDDPCQLPEQAGYRRLENQLYRIEIHDPKSGGNKATFKYSRDNGTVCATVSNISGNKITVSSLGKDKLLGFSIGQWIEIEDERRILWGMPGVLIRISDIDGSDLIYDQKIPSNAVINNNTFPQISNPKVKRWDSARGALNVEIATSNNGWIKIEDGIEIKFKNIDNDNDVCKTGDYCTFPARTLKADIEWPKGTDGLPKFVNSEGMEYHYAKLALLEYTGKELKLLSDCRDFFPSLTRLSDLSQPLSTNTKIVTSWVHGTSSDVEFPLLLADPAPPPGPGTKHGRGSLYRQVGEKNFPYNWFHFPLTILHQSDSEKKMILQKVYILFECKNAKIIDIDAYDGKKILATWGPKVSGSHDEEPDIANTFILEKPSEVHHSLGISVQVEFPINKPGEISFRAVGVQLRIG